MRTAGATLDSASLPVPLSAAELMNVVDPELERVIDSLHRDHGFDLRDYKRSTLYRRLRKRMGDVGAADADDYLGRVARDGAELDRLKDVVLINVTEFFRDLEAWNTLQRDHLAPLVARRGVNEPLRVWCVGCATGEEAYSAAMTFAELLPASDDLSRLKVYATDVDHPALAIARSGLFHAGGLRNVSQERIDRFFAPESGHSFKVRRQLRAAVVFGHHNILFDPPISRLDLVICRNLLIYLRTERQEAVLKTFDYALKPDGLLFLGKAETPLTRSGLFLPANARFRIFASAKSETLTNDH